jgi:hypothetical protein
MSNKKIEKVILPDGTLDVRTPDEGQPYFAESRAKEDVEVQAALDGFRASGVARPVVIHLGDDDPRSRAVWDVLLPALRGHGIATWKATAYRDDDCNYVMRPDRARELLRDVPVVKDAARFFRTPTFPVGYWSVWLRGGQVVPVESRTRKDMAAAGEDV